MTRQLVICAEDTEAAASAASWAVDEVYREGDKCFLVYVVKSLKPPMEVFHGLPGTAYSFQQPGSHHEDEKIAAAKRAIEKRFLPVLKRKMVPYEIQLFAEKYDVSPEQVGDTILKTAGDRDATLVVIASHNIEDKDRFEGRVGSVAQYVMRHCKYPLAVVNPEWSKNL